MKEEPMYIFPLDRMTKLTKWPKLCMELDRRGLHARPMELGDYELGYAELLDQFLEPGGQVSQAMFEERFKQMVRFNEVGVHYVIVVIEDVSTGKVIGTSSLSFEYEFVHQCGLKGRLGRLAVRPAYQGRGIGQILVKLMLELAREAYRCFKVILNCPDGLRTFYEKNNFIHEACMMTSRFDVHNNHEQQYR